MDKLNKFMDIWEIETHFKCPVVGAILSVEKHRSILKKCGWDVARLKPYEYHSTLMGCLGEENAVSVKVNNFIRHHARKIMVQVADLHARQSGGAARKAARQLWASWAEQGQIGPAMYALVSHEDTDVDLLRDIHGEVHMMAHANMTEVFDIRKKASVLHENMVRVKHQSAEKAGRIKELVAESRGHARSLHRMEEENARLRQQLAVLESRVDPEQDVLRDREDRILALERELAAAEDRALRAEKSEKQLQIEVFSAQNENGMIREEIQALVAAFSAPSAPSCPVAAAAAAVDPSPVQGVNCPVDGDCANEDCPNYTLCARRVFMIGGITKMKSYYREIVEKAGGIFDYHDGYMKSANENLEAKVRRCDVVVCPVSCNSHNACLRVKKLCQRYNKELKILNSASLSAVTQALFVPETTAVN